VRNGCDALAGASININGVGAGGTTPQLPGPVTNGPSNINRNALNLQTGTQNQKASIKERLSRLMRKNTASVPVARDPTAIKADLEECQKYIINTFGCATGSEAVQRRVDRYSKAKNEGKTLSPVEDQLQQADLLLLEAFRELDSLAMKDLHLQQQREESARLDRLLHNKETEEDQFTKTLPGVKKVKQQQEREQQKIKNARRRKQERDSDLEYHAASRRLRRVQSNDHADEEDAAAASAANRQPQQSQEASAADEQGDNMSDDLERRMHNLRTH